MTDPGSAISISLEELETRIRAIIGRSSSFPDPEALRQTDGPSGGHSAQFAWRLQSSAQGLSSAVSVLGRHLEGLAARLATTGEEIVATDQSVADDVQALHGIADSVVVPAAPGGSSAPAAPAPYGPPTTSASSDGDTDETFE